MVEPAGYREFPLTIGGPIFPPLVGDGRFGFRVGYELYAEGFEKRFEIGYAVLPVNLKKNAIPLVLEKRGELRRVCFPKTSLKLNCDEANAKKKVEKLTQHLTDLLIRNPLILRSPKILERQEGSEEIRNILAERAGVEVSDQEVRDFEMARGIDSMDLKRKERLDVCLKRISEKFRQDEKIATWDRFERDVKYRGLRFDLKIGGDTGKIGRIRPFLLSWIFWRMVPSWKVSTFILYFNGRVDLRRVELLGDLGKQMVKESDLKWAWICLLARDGYDSDVGRYVEEVYVDKWRDRGGGYKGLGLILADLKSKRFYCSEFGGKGLRFFKGILRCWGD